MIAFAYFELHEKRARGHRTRFEPTQELAPDAATLAARHDAKQVEVRARIHELHDRETDEPRLIACYKHCALSIAHVPKHTLGHPHWREPGFDQPTRHIRDRFHVGATCKLTSADRGHGSRLEPPAPVMQMPEQSASWIKELDTVSNALQAVLRAIVHSEQQYSPSTSPLALLQQISDDPNWAWLQPLYRLIADIDHAATDTSLPATEIAAIGAHARALLSGVGAPIEQSFLARYRPLLQAEPAVTMAHSAALRALRDLPPEPESEAERLHAHHQWNMRRKHARGE